jgi:hypothetical protein
VTFSNTHIEGQKQGLWKYEGGTFTLRPVKTEKRTGLFIAVLRHTDVRKNHNRIRL